MTICLVADDHALVRDALAMTLGRLIPDADVREASDFRAAWAEANRAPAPSFVTVDLSMPGASPVEGVRRLRELLPDARILAVTGAEDDALMLAILGVGVNGFVPKAANASVLTGAVQLVLAGGVFLPPRLLALAGGGALPPPAPPRDRAAAAESVRTLGARRLEVLQLLADGLSNKDIARRLELSPATVKGYVAELIAHFEAQNRTQAVSRARDAGIV